MAVILPVDGESLKKDIKDEVNKSISTEAYLRRQYEKRLESKFGDLQKEQASQLEKERETFETDELARTTTFNTAEANRVSTFNTNEEARDAKVDEKIEDITNLQDNVSSIETCLLNVSLVKPSFTEEDSGWWTIDGKHHTSETAHFKESAKISLSDVKYIKGKMYSGTTYCIYQYFDSQGAFVSGCDYAESSSLVDINITEFPTNAAYISFTSASSRVSSCDVALYMDSKEVIDSIAYDAVNGESSNTIVSFPSEEGGWWTIDGEFHSSTSAHFFNSEMYDLSHATSITGTMHLATNYCSYQFFDESGNFVSGNDYVEEAGDYTIDVQSFPSNARYVSFTSSNTYMSSCNVIISTRVGGVTSRIDNLEYRSNVNLLATKNVLVFGDSFVAYNNYTMALQTKLGCNIINRGVGGSTIVRRTDKPNQSLICRYLEEEGAVTESGKGAKLPDTCDFIIIHAGVNDWIQSRPIGTLEEGLSNDSHIMSAMQILIKGLREKYDNVPIVWGTPCHTYSTNAKDFSWDSETGLLTEKTNNQGSTLNDIVNAIKKVCSMMSVPIIDYYSESGILPEIESNYNKYTADGIHPSVAGAERMATLAMEVIVKNCL